MRFLFKLLYRSLAEAMLIDDGESLMKSLLVSILATSLAKAVLIDDGESLMSKYLCSPSGTLPIPTFNLTTLPSFIDGRHPFCLIEI